MTNLSNRDIELLAGWNASETTCESGLTLATLIRRTALQQPEDKAVIFDGQCISYAELDRMATSVAHRLHVLGVGPGSLIGVHMERSIELIVALVGVIYSGAAYVPLDTNYPDERIIQMCEDANLHLLLIKDADASRNAKLLLREIRLITINDCLTTKPQDNKVFPSSPNHPAYVIYTSGSTGKPKGVQVSHRSVCNSILWLSDQLALSRSDRLLAKTSISFDASVWEIFAILQSGACLVLATVGGERNPHYLTDLLISEGITILPMVPSALKTLLDEPLLHKASALRHVVCGGELLDWPTIVRLRQSLPRITVHNLYGPTEATIYATGFRISPELTGEGSIPIGRPIANSQIYILDPDRQLLPVGECGELFIAGTGVAIGYLNRPELTGTRFLPNPFSPDPSARMYQTGDLGRWLPDGNIEYLGRNDSQVKVRGYRIETGEIETVLNSHPDVANCTVVTREDIPGDVRLVAYVVQRTATSTAHTLREYLTKQLPEFMIPQHLVILKELPLLASEKVDKKALPSPIGKRPELSTPFQGPADELEATCCNAFADVLCLEKVGRQDNFFELGGSSLLAMRVLEHLTRVTGTALTPPTIFAHADPAGLAKCLQDKESGVDSLDGTKRSTGASRRHNEDPIAIIGMAGRFPGASSIEELWNNLLAGRDSITQFSEEELDPSISYPLRTDANYVSARGVIDGVELFDNGFFGIPLREAEVMDPQHRIFLETAWECLERAGYAPDGIEMPVGVFAGVTTPTYLHRHVMAHPEAVDRVGEFQVVVGNDKDYVATRVAHKLNLRGPAIAVNTACSTSLVAIAQAVDSLRLGRCDMALAGGASVTSPPRSGYVYQEGAMLSKDGHTRTFDASATGTAFNDGAAAVLLKRLPDAIAEGDQIFAIIRGIATNNDGGGKASFTAPSVEGQAAVIAAAHEHAGISPRSISYVEAHGTATPLGDPIEIEGLTRAFRRVTHDKSYCRIGSIKSNIGHIVTAAGAAGIIKTSLALATEQIPPSIHFDKPNPNIDFSNSPFVVNNALTTWPRGSEPRRAGVSSFGVGGTNAHAVLEEAPMLSASPAAEGPQLLVLSAKTRSALGLMATRLADHLSTHQDINLADVAHTLRVGRSQFSHRLCAVGNTPLEFAAILRSADSPNRAIKELGSTVPQLTWLFPGQGAQYESMGQALYDHDQAFRSAFDDCLAAMQPILPFDLKKRMFSGEADSLVDTSATQPATFVIEYSLANYWLAQGLSPSALIGHSVGEFVAAVLAGVMSLADAAQLVAKRGAIMQALPGGSMLSVRLTLEKLLPILPTGLSLAAENGPAACVVAGPTAEVAAWQRQLQSDGVAARMLQTSHAFHSTMMDSAVEPFEAEVRQVRLSPPRIPIFSTLTGKLMTPEDATNPHYWARHLRETVRFSPAVQSALSTNDNVAFLEIGPRGTLSTLVRQHQTSEKRGALSIASLADTAASEVKQLLLAKGQLWCLGIDMLPATGHQQSHRKRVLLPTYPFERKRIWLDAPVASLSQIAARTSVTTALSAPPPLAIMPSIEPAMTPTNQAATASANRKSSLVARLRELFEGVAGVVIDSENAATSFVELGFDSLSLTQAALQVKKTFGVTVTFRQLMEKYRCVETLAQFLDEELPAEQPTPAPLQTVEPSATAMSFAPTDALSGDSRLALQLLQQQMQLITQQLGVLSRQAGTTIQQAVSVNAPPSISPALMSSAPAATLRSDTDKLPTQPSIRSLVEKPFGASPRLTLEAKQEFTPEQKQWLNDFLFRYNARSGKSKAFSQQHRKLMADPRVVTGFNPLWKDLVYPIVVDRSKGASLWDIDGNEYIDLLSCFGGNLLGYQPESVITAMQTQLQLGLEVGPQHPVTAEVATLISEFTGMERVGFCNTGSEAVMGAMRIARTVTGRKTIAIFSNSYHGIFDEVIVRGTKQLRSLSAAPGILANAVENILVLDWNSETSLRLLQERGPELAAIMTEPIQNKHPDIQPREFLHSLRKIADNAGCALIFDEVVTGFRIAPGGAQEFYGVRADIATYGKVIGGGLPFAAIAGKQRWLDALDGGFWQYGDDSFPEAGVTYFAGTFVRHPLALAASRATLLHLKAGGQEFYSKLNARTQNLIDRLNSAFAARGAPVKAVHCASIWRLQWDEDQKFVGLFYYLLRYHGLHVYEQFGHFVTEAMTEKHVDRIVEVFTSALDELIQLGFISARGSPASSMSLPVNGKVPSKNLLKALDPNSPPTPDAKLGRDPDGTAAWFIPNPDVPGKYMRLVS